MQTSGEDYIAWWRNGICAKFLHFHFAFPHFYSRFLLLLGGICTYSILQLFTPYPSYCTHSTATKKTFRSSVSLHHSPDILVPFSCIIPFFCILTPFSCILAPFSCIPTTFSCIIMLFSCILTSLSCILTPFFCILTPVSFILTIFSRILTLFF